MNLPDIIAEEQELFDAHLKGNPEQASIRNWLIAHDRRIVKEAFKWTLVAPPLLGNIRELDDKAIGWHTGHRSARAAIDENQK